MCVPNYNLKNKKMFLTLFDFTEESKRLLSLLFLWRRFKQVTVKEHIDISNHVKAQNPRVRTRYKYKPPTWSSTSGVGSTDE